MKRPLSQAAFDAYVVNPECAAYLASDVLEKRLHQQGYLRVRPRSLREITQFPHHQADRCQVHERQRIAEAIFKVLGQPTTPIEPRNRALDNPAFR